MMLRAAGNSVRSGRMQEWADEIGPGGEGRMHVLATGDHSCLGSGDGSRSRPGRRPHLDGWASQWDRLVDSSPLPSPFLRSWWLTGTGGPRPRFLFVVEVTGFWAAWHWRRELDWACPCLRIMGDGALCPDHLDLLVAPGYEDTAIPPREELALPPRRTPFGPEGQFGLDLG